ncbi:hypothetical protein Y1Q_0010276 [Alligator mississippiensis]|uniref:Uncharacterized protein n=1 Tax=Alligator mississippiensis TaxID=8496 RepID=A0A151P1H4_ALLMI|nr:hypothetical protein Y1Q_0010276 [Alligator mississippiensis]
MEEFSSKSKSPGLYTSQKELQACSIKGTRCWLYHRVSPPEHEVSRKCDLSEQNLVMPIDTSRCQNRSRTTTITSYCQGPLKETRKGTQVQHCNDILLIERNHASTLLELILNLDNERRLLCLDIEGVDTAFSGHNIRARPRS